MSGREVRDIAVVIGTIGRPLALERCLTAIFDGVALPGVVVVVDQSAGDETRLLATADRWRGAVEYRHLDSRGVSRARDHGLREARRPLVAFTDDDCVPEQGWVSEVAAAFHRAPKPGAVTGRVLPLGPAAPGVFAVSSYSGDVARDLAGRRMPWYAGTGGNLSVTVDAYHRASGFDYGLGVGSPGKAAEDIALLYSLLATGSTVRYQPSAIVWHERQDRYRRLLSRRTYAQGMGTFLRLTAQRGDPYAMWILARWAYDRGRVLRDAARRNDTQALLELRLQMRGLIEGLLG